MEVARREESRSLDRTGATSYLAFQLARLDRALDTEAHRRRTGQVVAAHRAALDEWRLLASDIEVDWALQHRREIREAARRLRGASRSAGLGATRRPEEEADTTLARLRLKLGQPTPARSESIPLVCDDPFVAADPATKPPLLEALVETSRRRQVIVLTDDPDVTAWARVERLTGDVGLVESTPIR